MLLWPLSSDPTAWTSCWLTMIGCTPAHPSKSTLYLYRLVLSISVNVQRITSAARQRLCEQHLPIGHGSSLVTSRDAVIIYLRTSSCGTLHCCDSTLIPSPSIPCCSSSPSLSSHLRYHQLVRNRPTTDRFPVFVSAMLLPTIGFCPL